MKRFLLSFALLLVAGTAFAQKSTDDPQVTPYYPAPPPELAPKTEQGMPIGDLSSPLARDKAKITQTAIASDAEAQLFSGADKIVWGRYAKAKGQKPGTVTVTKGTVWTVKGRLDGTAPGADGDYASIDGVVEKITAHHVVIRGEIAFRVAKIEDGAVCKVAGTLRFRRSGRSHVWRLFEGQNPCDGSHEVFDLVYDQPHAEKKPAKRG